ncbi:MAG: PAS domain S-box protein, partial [Candidatus Krumholzibacteria bacterium]|nr:PAS domain S-box protein [Candidatus Krumholzibacteria bacterium]
MKSEPDFVSKATERESGLTLRETVELIRDRETKLRESEERFRATFEQAAVGITHVSPDGHFLCVNDRFCDIVGYTRDEILSLTFQDITHPDDLETDLDHARRLLRGESDNYSTEKQYFRKDGGTVWVKLTATVLKDDAGKPRWFVSVVEDITEKKKAQQERDRILTLSQDLICIASMDGYLKYVNPAWERFLGYADEELLTKPFLDFVHPDDRKRTARELESLAAGQSTFDFELRGVAKDGTISHISWVVTPLADEDLIYCIGRDVTERKEAEKAVRESRRRLIKAQNVARMGFMDWNLKTNEIVWS